MGASAAQSLHQCGLMRRIMRRLLGLQELALNTKPLTLEHEAQALRLREQVPAPILAHFDRLIVQGKKGVAIVGNGACSECHVRLPSSQVAELASSNKVHICDNCGRYLCLVSGKDANGSPAEIPPKTRAPRICHKVNPLAD